MKKSFICRALALVALLSIGIINANAVMATGFVPRITVTNSDAPEIIPEQDYTGEISWITDQQYYLDEGEDAAFSIDYDLRLFKALRVNGQELTLFEDYTLQEGSTVVILDAEYVSNLPVGNYEVEAEYTDGKIFKTSFEVINDTDDDDGDIVVPDTGANSIDSVGDGDESSTEFIAPVLVIIAITVGSFFIYRFIRRKSFGGWRNSVKRSKTTTLNLATPYTRHRAASQPSISRFDFPTPHKAFKLHKVAMKPAIISALVLLAGVGLGVRLIHALSDNGANATIVEDADSLAISTTESEFVAEADLSNGSTFLYATQDVSIDAPTVNGYQLFISTNSDTYNDLSINGSALGDTRITAGTGTSDNPDVLGDDQWGYATINNSFGNDYLPSSTSLWAGIPIYDTKATLRTVYGATPAHDTTTVYYGFNISNNLPDGMYWGTENSTVLYTAIANVVPDYTVTFDCNDGQENSSTQTVTMGDTVRLGDGSTCSLENYVLAGWNTAPDSDGTSYAPNSQVTIYDDLYLYAMWNIVSPDEAVYNYTLSYDANGGIGAPAVQNVDSTSSEVTFTISDTEPTYEGYTFLGWRLNNNGSIYHASDTITVNKLNSTLYAYWQSNGDGSKSGTTETLYTYTLTYNANGQSSVPDQQSITTPSGNVTFTVSNNIPSYAGHTFLGWSTNSAATSANVQPGTRYTTSKLDTVLYAVWGTERTYTLHYNLNGGAGAPPSDQSLTDTDSSVIFAVTSDAPSREGFDFLGWSTDSSATSAEYTAGKKITVASSNPEVTLYAVWGGKHTYTLNYNANGGTGAPNSDTFVSTEDEHAFVISSDTPTRDGYAFAGWATSNTATTYEYKAGWTVNLTADDDTKTLYAVWLQNHTYSLSYSANGGTGAPSAQQKTTTKASATFTISSTIPSREGYTFLGWANSETATEKEYSRGSSITVSSPSTTLYAVWSSESSDPGDTREVTYTYTLRYDANGGTGTVPGNQSNDTKETHYTFNVPSSPTPTRDGYEFKGWNTNRYATSASVEAGGTYNANSDDLDVTLYAIWAAKYDYYLWYSANGGTGAPSTDSTTTTAKSWTTTVSTTTPTHGTYKFLGWSRNSSATTPDHTYDPGKTITLTSSEKAFKLYAVWQAQYTHGLKYNLNGGSNGPADDIRTSATKTESFTVGNPNPTHSNADFLGWTDTKGGTTVKYRKGDSISISGDKTITLYAIWQPKYTYKLTYSANGGDAGSVPAAQSSGKVTTTSHTFDINTSTKPTRSGYTFLGWATNAAATSANVGNTLRVTSSSTTIYAVWKKNGPVKVSSITVKGTQKLDYNSPTKRKSQLNATVSPSNAANKSVTWSSSNNKVVTVSSTGLVTAKGPGKATITVKSNDLGAKTTYEVEVHKKIVIVIGASQVERMHYKEGYRGNANYADIRQYPTTSDDPHYTLEDTLFFRAVGGTGFYFQYYNGGKEETDKKDHNNGWGYVYYNLIKQYKSVKDYVHFHVYFPMAGNDIWRFTCNDIINDKKVNTSADSEDRSLTEIARLYKKAIYDVRQGNYDSDGGYDVTGYVVSNHPLDTAHIKDNHRELTQKEKDSGMQSDENWVKDSSAKKCDKKVRSNYKYNLFNQTMQSAITDGVGQYKYLKYIELFKDIMSPSHFDVFNKGWKDYETKDGVHWKPDTARKYFDAMLNKTPELLD